MFYFPYAYLNDISAFVMDRMAKEGLSVFYETRILGNYVSTDFSPEFASPGEEVFASYPGEVTADRLPERGSMAITDAASTKKTMKLNQHLYVAMNFYDREKIRSEKDLVDTYIAPMARGLAQKYDRAIQGEMFGSYLYTAGNLGTDLSYNVMTDAATLQTENYVPVDGRNAIVGPRMAGQIKKSTAFVANVSMTNPALIRTGVIGEVAGYLASETPSFLAIAQSTNVTGAINNASGYAAGSTALTVDAFSAAITSNSWCKVDGVPYRIASTTGGATPTVITLANALRAAVADNAVVVVYTPSVVNLTAGYAVGWEDKIGFDGGVVPKLGQGVTFGADGVPYTVVKVDATDVWLNRPLDVAVANDASMFLMPGGNYGIGISRNSIQVVTRPLPTPTPGSGVQASVAIGENFAIRLRIGHDILTAKETISMDCIMGVANHFPQYNVLLLG